MQWLPGSGCHLIAFDDGERRRISVADHLEDGILRWLSEVSDASIPTAAAEGARCTDQGASGDAPTVISLTKPQRIKRPVERFDGECAESDKRQAPSRRRVSPSTPVSQPVQRGDSPSNTLTAGMREAEGEAGVAPQQKGAQESPDLLGIRRRQELLTRQRELDAMPATTAISGAESRATHAEVEARMEQDAGEEPKSAKRGRRSPGSAKSAASPPSSSRARAATGGAPRQNGRSGSGGPTGGGGMRSQPSVRSVGQCGLPAGALAVGRSGFEVRALNGASHHAHPH